MSTPATFDIDEAAQQTLLAEYLESASIPTRPIVQYPAHNSIDEGKQLRGDLPGTFTKNLLLRDKKRGLFFVTAHEDTEIDLKTLHTKVGGRGRLGFAAIEVMVDLLKVVPGTATPLALFHDEKNVVTLVVDHVLEGAEQLNFHPMTHTESIGLTWDDFVTFAETTGHSPLVTTLTEEKPSAVPTEIGSE